MRNNEGVERFKGVGMIRFGPEKKWTASGDFCSHLSEQRAANCTGISVRVQNSGSELVFGLKPRRPRVEWHVSGIFRDALFTQWQQNESQHVLLDVWLILPMCEYVCAFV